MPMSRCVLLGPPAAPSAGNGISMLQKITGPEAFLHTEAGHCGSLVGVQGLYAV